MAIEHFQQDICLWGVNQDPKYSKEPLLYAPGTQVLTKVWKDGSPKAQLQPTWKVPFPVILSTPEAVKVPGHDSWIHYSWVKSRKKTEEDTQYTCEPLGDLRYLLRTTNECHSNKQPQNLVSGDKISQDSSKEPTQLGRNSTPEQTGDRSSDLWTRRDLSHPGDVNLKLADAPTSCSMYCQLSNLSCLCNQVRLQHAVQRSKTTVNHRKYQSPLDGHPYKDSEA